MNIIKTNTREITKEEAYIYVNNLSPTNYDDLIKFCRRFDNKKEIIISRGVGLDDSVIERKNRKYYISDIDVKFGG